MASQPATDPNEPQSPAEAPADPIVPFSEPGEVEAPQPDHDAPGRSMPEILPPPD